MSALRRSPSKTSGAAWPPSALTTVQLGAVDAAVEEFRGHLFQGLHVANALLLLDLEERRAGDVNVPLLDQLPHLAVEEGQDQRADMLAVDVGIGQDDDLAVAQPVRFPRCCRCRCRRRR